MTSHAQTNSLLKRHKRGNLYSSLHEIRYKSVPLHLVIPIIGNFAKGIVLVFSLAHGLFATET